MKGKFTKDYCPFAKDQGFLSVIGNVALGESVFGFTVTSTGAGQAIVFATVTAPYSGQSGNKVHEMKNIRYKIQITKVSSGSLIGTVGFWHDPLKTGFTMEGETGEDYDVIVVGKVAF
jgi:hypothetical protein